jgi:hypothetical protein
MKISKECIKIIEQWQKHLSNGANHDKVVIENIIPTNLTLKTLSKY